MVIMVSIRDAKVTNTGVILYTHRKQYQQLRTRYDPSEVQLLVEKYQIW